MWILVLTVFDSFCKISKVFMNLIILSVTLLVLPMASSFTPLLATKFEMPTFGKKVAAPTKALTKASTKVPKNAVKVPSRIASIALSAPSLPTPSVGSVFDGGIVGIAGKGMSLLSIPFGLEAKVQAAALGLVGEIVGSPFRFNSEDVRAELQEEISKNKAVIYTYAWSPFSASALDALDGYDVEVIELGAEWFLMMPDASEKRVALGELTGSTALPKLFVNKEYQGGFSTGGPSSGGIAGLEKSGELGRILKKKAGKKVGRR